MTDAAASSSRPEPSTVPTPAAAMLRALVVDDDLLFADFLEDEIKDILPNLVRVRVCGSPEEAIDYAREVQPDIAFIDVRFRESPVSGFELANDLHSVSPDSKIVILSAAASGSGWETTLAMGDAVLSHAVQYLSKDIRRVDFVAALTRVVEGFEDLPSIVAQRLRSHGSPREEILSRRELEVLDLIARGSTAKDVSKRLNIAARTVNDYTEHARLRLGAHTTTEAVAIAVQLGLIPLKD